MDCGRRWGKTWLGIDALADASLQGAPVAWFSPTYKMMADVWRDFNELLKPYITRSNSTERRIELISGGVIDLWSLDSTDAGRGRKYARVVVDEAAMVRNILESFNAAIRPTLTDYQGDAWFLSTPKGRNGFYQLYQRGQDEQDPDWMSWQMPTRTNPFIAVEEIEAARRMLPDRVFEQEYLAEFLEDSAVFRHIQAAVRATKQDKPIDGHKYIIGCDWGKLEDFTVFTVMDATNKEIAFIDRMTSVDYVTQADRLEYLDRKWKPEQVVTETTGVGEPIADILRQRSIGIRSFQTTRRSKEELLGWLIRAFDEYAIGIIDDPVLISELQMMEAKSTATGFKYGAPAGYHDDMVMSLALAWDGVRKGTRGARVVRKRKIMGRKNRVGRRKKSDTHAIR